VIAGAKAVNSLNFLFAEMLEQISARGLLPMSYGPHSNATLVCAGDAHGDALDLERGVFTKRSPRAIARSLKRSAERFRKKGPDPFSEYDVA
jgi:hypothetical protein